MAPYSPRQMQYEMLSHTEQTTEPSLSEYVSPYERSTKYTSIVSGSQSSVKPRTKRESSRTTRLSQWRKTGNKFWLLEFGSWFLGFASLGAIVGVLITYDNKPIPSLAYGITLGALISVLSTIATVFLTVPLAAGLGQARWLWFKNYRKLADFELITDASRSPLSAFELILKGKGGALTIFGASFMIIILAINPFVQQVVKTDMRWDDRTATASLPVANNYTIAPTDSNLISADVDLTMKAAIYRGLLQVEAQNSAFNVNPTCPTGNCNWSTYGSLSVCGRCTDLTTELSLTNSTNVTGETTASLTNGVSITWQDSFAKEELKTIMINNTIIPTALKSVAYPDVNFPLTDAFVLIGEYGSSGPYAAECVLQFCAQNMTASSVNGTFAEETIGQPLYLEQDYGSYFIYAEDGPKNWTVDYQTYQGLNNYFGKIFNSFTQQVNSLSPISEWTDDVSQAAFFYMNGSSHTLDGLFNNLASSMSQHIREASTANIVGTSASQIPFVKVEWLWMILPLIVLVAVLIFLVCSIIATTGAGLEPWKESSTAVLFHGLDDKGRASLLRIDKRWEMDEMADSLQMRLRRSDDGLNLRAAHQPGI